MRFSTELRDLAWPRQLTQHRGGSCGIPLPIDILCLFFLLPLLCDIPDEDTKWLAGLIPVKFEDPNPEPGFYFEQDTPSQKAGRIQHDSVQDPRGI